MKKSLLLVLAMVCWRCNYAQEQRYTFTESKMGSPFTIILYSGDSVSAAVVARESFLLVDSLVNIFSDYIDSSELNRLCARAGTGFVGCSPVLYDLLMQSKKAYSASGGKFDVSLGPLTRLWRAARKSGHFPDSATVMAKKKLTGFDKILFDSASHSVSLKSAGMQLDFGGIGQGYIAGCVGRLLAHRGITSALIDVSGDIVTIGRPPGKKGWTVAINVPESAQALLPRHLLLSNMAVTTSGDVYQNMTHDGLKYSHIIDPATGYGIVSQKNVTVIAADGTTADWFTKACSLMPFTAAKKLARRVGAEFLITDMRAGKVLYQRSRKFDTYWKKEPG